MLDFQVRKIPWIEWTRYGTTVVMVHARGELTGDRTREEDMTDNCTFLVRVVLGERGVGVRAKIRNRCLDFKHADHLLVIREFSSKSSDCFAPFHANPRTDL